MTEPYDIHSAEYINDSRYYWWNKDYLQLLLSRINIGNVRSIADIGIGAAHWSSLIASNAEHLKSLTGVDTEEHWLDVARKTLASALLPSTSLTLLKADAHELPLDGNSIDLVTCQTLLIHCADPQKVIEQMARVARPGGWLLVVEPVNVLNRAQLFDAIALLDPSEQAKLLELWSRYHVALQASSGMNHDIALTLPRLLINAGLEEVNMFANDRVIIRTDAKTAVDDMDTEYTKRDVSKLLESKGVSASRVKVGRRLSQKLFQRIRECGNYMGSPLNMFAAIGKKKL